jgi:hypothetical protein
MQSMPASTCRLTVSAMAGVTCAAMTAGSVIWALASRPGMFSQPLGGGSRPTCEVLIRVTLRCIFLSSPVPAYNPQYDNRMNKRSNWGLIGYAIGDRPGGVRTRGRKSADADLPRRTERGCPARSA